MNFMKGFNDDTVAPRFAPEAVVPADPDAGFHTP